MEAILAHIPAHWLPYVAAAVALASALATLLPAPRLPASGFYPVFYHVVNWVALNVGKAKNKGAP